MSSSCARAGDRKPKQNNHSECAAVARQVLTACILKTRLTGSCAGEQGPDAKSGGVMAQELDRMYGHVLQRGRAVGVLHLLVLWQCLFWAGKDARH